MWSVAMVASAGMGGNVQWLNQGVCIEEHRRGRAKGNGYELPTDDSG